ncbi:MAG TPA: copper resistance protein CopC [Micromonosporaceae bacterium]|nr:copper resistance protein CopC [Micromonosporaceae bacterium]
MTRRWAARRPAGRLLVSIAVIAITILLTPTSALAHAVLVSSSPAAGSTVGTTPESVVLRFDEALAPTLSHADVVDPAGQRFIGVVDGQTMTVRVKSTVPGVYQVDWTTVSEVDGHTITGRFEFGVAVPVTASSVGGVRGPTPGDFAVALLRGIEFALLLLACGLVTLRRIARGVPVREIAVPVAVGLLISAAAVVVAEANLATTRPSLSAVADYLSIGMTGWARLAGLVLAAALVAFAVRQRVLSPPLVAGIVIVLCAAGHAANVEPAWFGIAVNALHVGAAGVWAGGIMAMAVQWLAGSWSVAGQPLLKRFARVAPWAFAASVGLGLLEATQLLDGLGGLLDTGYGRVLVVKGALVAGMAVLSVLAVRHRPMVRTEASLAVLVVAVAAVLTAFPVVPKEAREAAERAANGSGNAAVAAFPRAGDVTLAGRAGDTLVALTVRPGRPGTNQVFAYVAPSPTGTVRLTVDGAESDLFACGESCWSGTVNLRGAQPAAVEVGGAHAGTANFTLPPLPAPDGGALVERGSEWMAGLLSYSVDEDFSGIRSTYAFAVPHEMYLRMWLSGVPHDTLWLGTSKYKRSSPTMPWSAPIAAQPAPVPYLAWKPFEPVVDARVVGSGSIHGVPVRLVSFFGGHGADPEPVWFTLWIDESHGTVLRSQMWAPGHFMDDRYGSFNQPVQIPRPPGT